jgi:hypothetical protein
MILLQILIVITLAAVVHLLCGEIDLDDQIPGNFKP